MILSQKFKLDLEAAIQAQSNSILGYGSEFRPVHSLKRLLHKHPLWSKFEKMLTVGADYPLEPMSEEDRLQDITDAMERGNHKSAKQKHQVLETKLFDEVRHGWELPLPLDKVPRLPGSLLAPLGVADQETINEQGEVIPSDRVTHDQSFPFSSGTSVNIRVIDEELTPCMCGHMLSRLIHYIVATRIRHPFTRILLQKVDYKSACRRGHLNSKSAVQTIVGVGTLALLALRLTFGGKPNPSMWGDISETACDLANDLLQCPEWDPNELYNPVQSQLPPPKFEDDDVPFAPGLELAVDLPINNLGFVDVFIDDTITAIPDIGNNVDRGEGAALLAMHIIGRPCDDDEALPRKDLTSLSKLIAEGRMEELKIIIGWLLDTRRMSIALPEHKFIAWVRQLQDLIDNEGATYRDLDQLIGRLNHVGYIIPNARHFLSRLRRFKDRAANRRWCKARPSEIDDAILFKKFLRQAKDGISLNLITYRKPTHVCRSDASEHGIGGYNLQTGRAWRFYIPQDLLCRLTLNTLEFVGSIVTVWIDFLEGNLPPLSCVLSQGDSTSSTGWLRKSNFDEELFPAHLKLARKYAEILIEASSQSHSQWFKGKANGVSDCLSRDYNLSDQELTLLLQHCIPEQVPQNFHISPLPKEIVSWLTSLMRTQPDKMLPPKVPTKSDLQLSTDGSNFLATLDSEMTHSWTDSPSPSGTEPSEPLQLPCEKADTLLTDTIDWWRGPLPPPWTTWHRPFGLTTGRTPASMKTVKPHTFYSASVEATKTKTDKPSNKKRLPPPSSERLPTCEPPSKMSRLHN